MKKPVIICTEFRGVFFGYIAEDTPIGADPIILHGAKCAIRWATKKGIFELAVIGPNEKSIIGAKAESVELRKITSVIAVSECAEKRWKDS